MDPTHEHANIGRQAKTNMSSVRTQDAVKKTFQERWMTRMDDEREGVKESARIGQFDSEDYK